MQREIQSVIDRHRDFWKLKPVGRPLIGYCIGGWSQMQLYGTGRKSLPTGLLKPDMLKPELFLRDYEKILTYNNVIQDDLIRSVEPFPAIPWMEAIIGCPVYNSGENIWSEPIPDSISELEQIQYNPDSLWVRKYMEFIDVLTAEFGSRYPVGQTILRGPADVLSAAIGEAEFIYALHDSSDQMARLARSFMEIHNEFLRDQIKRFPEFQGGYVIGQYHIWAPGRCSRLQEDAVALLSPGLYKQFFQNPDREIAKVAEFNLIHLHTTSLFLLDLFLEIDGLKAIQVSLDSGGPELEDIIESLKKIQKAGKGLVIKGVLNESSIARAQAELSAGGLCLQAVVNDVDEAKALQDIFDRNDKWNR